MPPVRNQVTRSPSRRCDQWGQPTQEEAERCEEILNQEIACKPHIYNDAAKAAPSPKKPQVHPDALNNLGLTPALKAFTLARNAMQFFRSGLRLAPKCPIRTCSGGKSDTTCPFDVVISVDSAFFHIKRDKLSLNSYCVLCGVTKSRSRIRPNQRPPEPDGRQLCKSRLTCMEENVPGKAGCAKHVAERTEHHKKHATASRLASAFRDRGDRVGLGHGILDAEAMARLLEDTTFYKPRIYDELKAILDNSNSSQMPISVNPNSSFTSSPTCLSVPAKAFAIDTEYIAGGEDRFFLLSICVIDLQDHRVVVNHRTKLEIEPKELKEICEGFGSKSPVIGQYNKHYGDYNSPSSRLPIIDGTELHQLLVQAGFGPQSLLIEWSTGWCDWTYLERYLRSYSVSDIMPPKENSCRVVYFFRELLPGFCSHKLSLLAPIFLADAFIDQSHVAEIDVLNLIAMAEKAIYYLKYMD